LFEQNVPIAKKSPAGEGGATVPEVPVRLACPPVGC
jgi:hypothetical protein